MSATAILDTILVVIANDVSNRLINDDRFAANVARSLLHFGTGDEAAASSLRQLLVPAIASDENFREFVRQEVSHGVDLIVNSDSFSLNGEQIMDFDDAVERRVSEILQREDSDSSIKADDIDGLEEAIDDRIERTSATMSDVEREVKEQLERSRDIIVGAIESPEGRAAIMKVLVSGITAAAAPREEMLDFNEAFPYGGAEAVKQPPLRESELAELITIE